MSVSLRSVVHVVSRLSTTVNVQVLFPAYPDQKDEKVLHGNLQNIKHFLLFT